MEPGRALHSAPRTAPRAQLPPRVQHLDSDTRVNRDTGPGGGEGGGLAVSKHTFRYIR